jgi:hypothetical protein
LKNTIVIGGLVAALATGGSIAQAKPEHASRPDRGGHGKGHAGPRQHHGHAKRCAKKRKVGFVVGGTFVAGDATSVTLMVTKANRHARQSGLVALGENYTATPTKAARIKYVNRTGAEDAQPTDRVRVVGKVTAFKHGCSSEGFTPTATVRKVKVVGGDAAPGVSDESGNSDAGGRRG